MNEIYMQRALTLAALGRQDVSPNPMVGCVIVHDGLIIGEGYHQKYGGPHAEVNAINSVKDQELLKDATLYVTLEPCAHFGKTPPCANLIVQKQIPRVVVCNVDPNPLVAGKGIQILKEAGIEVQDRIAEKQGWELNKRFFTYHSLKRPYIILKWAQTADGFIARENFDSKWISDKLSRTLTHKWRSEEDAIMVGTNTALKDNPHLTNRAWSGYSPLRIVIDKNLKLAPSSNLFDQSQTTLCYNAIEDRADEYNQFIKLDFSTELIPQIMDDLYQRKIQSVLVEGGSGLHYSFIQHNVWDEARVFVSKSATFGKGVGAQAFPHGIAEKHDLIGDELLIYKNKSF